jgi:CheY-like chemotaxis protein
MDIQMPRVDGLEATRRIRRLEEGTNRHLPVVALSAHVLEEEKEKCRVAGMDNFLSKPIDREALDDLLDHFGRRVETVDAGDGSGGSPSAPEEPEGREGAPTEKDPFDLQEMAAFLDGDEEMLGELVTMFLEDSSHLFSRIRSGIVGGNASEVEAAAHQLKGSAANFRAPRVMEEAYRVETLGRDGDLEAAADVLPGLEEALGDLQEALQRLAQKSS